MSENHKSFKLSIGKKIYPAKLTFTKITADGDGSHEIKRRLLLGNTKGHCHPRASSAKTRGFHTQLD